MAASTLSLMADCSPTTLMVVSLPRAAVMNAVASGPSDVGAPASRIGAGPACPAWAPPLSASGYASPRARSMVVEAKPRLDTA